MAKSEKLIRDMLEFANRVDHEGYHEVAQVFRSAAARYYIKTCVKSFPGRIEDKQSRARTAAIACGS